MKDYSDEAVFHENKRNTIANRARDFDTAKTDLFKLLKSKHKVPLYSDLKSYSHDKSKLNKTISN